MNRWTWQLFPNAKIWREGLARLLWMDAWMCYGMDECIKGQINSDPDSDIHPDIQSVPFTLIFTVTFIPVFSLSHSI